MQRTPMNPDPPVTRTRSLGIGLLFHGLRQAARTSPIKVAPRGTCRETGCREFGRRWCSDFISSTSRNFSPSFVTVVTKKLRELDRHLY